MALRGWFAELLHWFVASKKGSIARQDEDGRGDLLDDAGGRVCTISRATKREYRACAHLFRDSLLRRDEPGRVFSCGAAREQSLCREHVCAGVPGSRVRKPVDAIREPVEGEPAGWARHGSPRVSVGVALPAGTGASGPTWRTATTLGSNRSGRMLCCLRGVRTTRKTTSTCGRALPADSQVAAIVRAPPDNAAGALGDATAGVRRRPLCAGDASPAKPRHKLHDGDRKDGRDAGNGRSEQGPRWERRWNRKMSLSLHRRTNT